MIIKIITTICLALVALVTNAQAILSEQHPTTASNDSINTKADTIKTHAPHAPHDTSATTSATGMPSTRIVTRGTTTDNEGEYGSVNTNMKIMRHSYKTTGYRIQIYSGGNKRVDRQKCQQISTRIKSYFPDLPVYVHFYSPSWKCRAGNFVSQQEANDMLKKIRALGYPQACLVKGKINVQY